MDVADAEFKLAVTEASEKRTSRWVTACPSHEHGTVLHKRVGGHVLHPLRCSTCQSHAGVPEAT